MNVINRQQYRCCEHWIHLRGLVDTLINIPYHHIEETINTHQVFQLGTNFLTTLYGSSGEKSLPRTSAEDLLAAFLVNSHPRKMLGDDLDSENVKDLRRDAEHFSRWFFEAEIGNNSFEKTKRLIESWGAIWQGRAQEEKTHLEQLFYEELYGVLRALEVAKKLGRHIPGAVKTLEFLCHKLTQFGSPVFTVELTRKIQKQVKQDISNLKIIDFDKIVREVTSQAYWQTMEQEMLGNNFEKLIKVLTEIKNRCLALMKNRPEQFNAFNEYFDLEILANVISHDKFDLEVFEGIFLLIWNCLKEQQAPRHDDSWKVWYTETVQEITRSKNWASVIPLILNKFLSKLDEIEAEVKMFKSALPNAGLTC